MPREYFYLFIFIDLILLVFMIHYLFVSDTKSKKNIFYWWFFGLWPFLIEDYKNRRNGRSNKFVIIGLLIMVSLVSFALLVLR